MTDTGEMSASMRPLALTNKALVTAVGRTLSAHRRTLHEGRSALICCDLPHADLDTMIGRVEGLEDEPLEGALAAFDCRNNRLAAAGLRRRRLQSGCR